MFVILKAEVSVKLTVLQFVCFWANTQCGAAKEDSAHKLRLREPKKRSNAKTCYKHVTRCLQVSPQNDHADVFLWMSFGERKLDGRKHREGLICIHSLSVSGDSLPAFGIINYRSENEPRYLFPISVRSKNSPKKSFGRIISPYIFGPGVIRKLNEEGGKLAQNRAFCKWGKCI